MIDNHDKELLRCKWNFKIYVLYLLNGTKSVLGSRKKKIFISVYLILFFLFYINRFLFFDRAPLPLLVNVYDFCILFLVVLSWGVILLVILFFMGMPNKAKSISNNLQRMGLVNSAGEAPVLISRKQSKKNTKIMILEFISHGIPLSEWQDNHTKIESALNIGIDHFDEGNDRRKILVYAVDGKYRLPNKISWDKKMLIDDSFTLVLGESLVEPITVNLAKIPHILIGGSTGSGKSVLLKLLLMQCIIKGAEVYIADFKGGVDFSGIWHTTCEIFTDEEKLCFKLDRIVDELNSRKVLFRSHGCANIDVFNEMAEQKLKRIIFGCDEIAEVLDKTGLTKEKKNAVLEIENKLSVIARQGRAFGIHLILATQRPDANIISGQIKNNIDFRVCGRADNILSQIILDKADANDKIPKCSQGRFLSNNDVLFQGYCFNDSEWEI